MTRFLRRLALLSLVAPAFAHATLLDFTPADSTIDLGDTIAIDIVATPESGELIGAFDFIVNFNPAVLALNDLVFGASLNAVSCDPFCRGFFDTGGAVEMFEAAFPFTPLGSLQDGIAPVVLATLVFDAVGVGISDLSFTGNIFGQLSPLNLLGDEFGIPLPVFEPGTGRVVVAAQVAEPPAFLLMLTGLLGLVARQRWMQETATI